MTKNNFNNILCSRNCKDFILLYDGLGTYYLYYQGIKYAINNEFNIFNLGTVANKPLKISFNTLNYFLMPEFILKNNKILAYLNKYHK